MRSDSGQFFDARASLRAIVGTGLREGRPSTRLTLAYESRESCPHYGAARGDSQSAEGATGAEIGSR